MVKLQAFLVSLLAGFTAFIRLLKTPEQQDKEKQRAGKEAAQKGFHAADRAFARVLELHPKNSEVYILYIKPDHDEYIKQRDIYWDNDQYL